MLSRCSTTFSTIGYSYCLISLATFDFSSKVRVLLRKSFNSRVESWNDNWIWSRPPSLNAAMRFSVSPTPEVSRLV